MSHSTISADRATNSIADSSRHWPRLRRALPTATVVVALVGLALAGHWTDWRMPKFSALAGSSSASDAGWCPTHNVAEAECIECNDRLYPRGKDYGWCKEHGVAQCVLEHPDVAQLSAAATVEPEDFERAKRALALRPRPENNSHCRSREQRIQFTSIEAMAKAGVDIAVVGRKQVVEAVTANGEVNYDETRMAHLASRVAGTVSRVDRQVGDPVRRGDILALVDAVEVGRAKTELLQAVSLLRLRQANHDRLKALAGDGTVAGRSLVEAEASLQEANIRLLGTQQALVNLGFTVPADALAKGTPEEMARQIQLLGLPPEVIDSLGEGTATSNLYALRAPLDGVVVGRHVVSGEVVDTATTLFEVADVRQMWLMLDLRLDDARFVELGQRVLFRASDSRDGAEIAGQVRWLSTSADSQTRTVKVRVDLPNPDGRLRANTFGTGRIILREEPSAIVVPSEAIHFDGDCSFAFVRDKDFLSENSPKFFHVRQVRVGVSDGEGTEIIAGLLPGEVIASRNSAILAAQLLKSRLGAGCGCVEAN